MIEDAGHIGRVVETTKHCTATVAHTHACMHGRTQACTSCTPTRTHVHGDKHRQTETRATLMHMQNVARALLDKIEHFGIRM